jgi:hypothetical protein
LLLRCRSCLQTKQQEASASATKKGVQLKAASKQLDKLKKDISKSGEHAALLLLLLLTALSLLCGCLVVGWQHILTLPIDAAFLKS